MKWGKELNIFTLKKIFYNSNSYYYNTIILQQNKVKYYSTHAPFKPNKDIVVWGCNLSSTAGAGRFTKIVRNMFVLPPYHKSVVVGILLSDGYLTTKLNENPRLEFKQSIKNSKYVLFVYNILCHYCHLYPYVLKNVRKDKVHLSLFFYTLQLACFGELRSLFYINKVKIVPEDIYNLLTPVALAHLIMGDGVGKDHGLIICTDSYKIVDVVRILNVLIIRYNIDCRVRYHTPTQPRNIH